ncbi:MAG: cofactor-independent phosphoglycerate mutase [Christensenellales bacterium]
MKYMVVLGDGMADYPVKELGGKTPLQAAVKENMDEMARGGEVGLVQTTPEGLPPGSDTTNLAIMGYDPRLYYTGRSPLEAVSMGVDLKDDDVTFRMNLVTLSDDEPYEQKTMVDYSADEISTPQAALLVRFLSEHLHPEARNMKMYAGVYYRHCLVWSGGAEKLDLTPPHDISGQKISSYLPKGEGSRILFEFMKQSYALLKDHPVNEERRRKGLRAANSVWFWGEGKKPQLSSLSERYGKKAVVISAVDLIKGIGISAGMKSIQVEGATGTVDTNYEGKAKAALKAFSEGYDYAYIHLEGPDECGHHHDTANKVKAIEQIDKRLIGVLRKGLDEMKEDYCMLVLPDHPTPIEIGTHTRDAVPYVLFCSTKNLSNGASSYSEEEAAKTGMVIQRGDQMLDKLFAL